MPIHDVVGGSDDADNKRPKKAKSISYPTAEETAEFLMSSKVQNWAKRIQYLKNNRIR